MKNSLKSKALVLSLLAGGLLSACTTEEGFDPKEGIRLAKQTEVYAYSNGISLKNGTRSNAGDGYIGNSVWKQFNADALENITDEERQAVLAAIAEKVTGSQISEDIVFPWTDYFLQDVISAQSSYGDAGNSGNPSASYIFEVWNTGADCSPWSHHGSDYENYEEVSNSAHLNNYFQKQNPDGSQERINETTLMTNMQYSTYEEMKGKQFRWYINCHENLHWYEYIVVEVDGNYYICFDFACGHKENDIDGNPGRGNTQNDWDYNDWILKISPAVPYGEDPEDVWGVPEKNQDPETPETPDAPAVVPDHVEVNLSVEEHKDWLSTHLSIHVRAVTDVEVFIPVPSKYYCDADDMAIVEKHVDEFIIHGGPEVTTWNVNGNSVTLTVEFEEDGIRVTTSGINENVIAYLDETYGDGITFEVWNYFNGEIDRDTLKDRLDNEAHATVKFLDNCPDLYVNAFNDVDETGEMFDYDCFVDIVGEQAEQYNNPETGMHYNGSPYNELYYNKDYNKEEQNPADEE